MIKTVEGVDCCKACICMISGLDVEDAHIRNFDERSSEADACI